MPKFLLTPDEAEQAFYDALRSGSVDGMMSIWSDDEEIMCLHPSGPPLLGHQAVEAGWKQILSGQGVHVEVTRVRAMGNPMYVIHSIIEKITIPQGPGANPNIVFTIATHVYAKESLGWRMVLRHASATAPQNTLVTQTSPKVLH